MVSVKALTIPTLFVVLASASSIQVRRTLKTAQPQSLVFQLTQPLQERDSCPSGSQQITHIGIGTMTTVCCPGSLVDNDTDPACCVGGNGDSDFIAATSTQCGAIICLTARADISSTSSCVTKVPITAADYSSKVFGAASSTTSAFTTTTDGTATTTTATGLSAISALSTSASHGGAGMPMITGVALQQWLVGGAAVVALMA